MSRARRPLTPALPGFAPVAPAVAACREHTLDTPVTDNYLFGGASAARDGNESRSAFPGIAPRLTPDRRR